MNDPFKGESPLTRLSDPLTVRARVGLAVVAADLALTHLRDSPDPLLTRTIFELARRWFDGARFDADRFADVLDPEYERTCKLRSRGQMQEEASAWTALADAAAYVGFHAYDELGQCAAPGFSELDETILDDIDKSMRPISPEFMKTMKTAAGYLQREARASFAQLNGVIAQRDSEH